MSGRRKKRYLLTIAAVGTGVSLAACGSDAVGSVANVNDGGDDAQVANDGGPLGLLPGDAGDAHMILGTVPMDQDAGHDASIVGVGTIVHPDADLGE